MQIFFKYKITYILFLNNPTFQAIGLSVKPQVDMAIELVKGPIKNQIFRIWNKKTFHYQHVTHTLMKKSSIFLRPWSSKKDLLYRVQSRWEFLINGGRPSKVMYYYF